MLSVVGVGLKRNHLTLEAINKIKGADIVYGSGRAIRIAKDFISCDYEILREFNQEIYGEIEKRATENNIVVLSTGDPMILGLGRFFKGEIIPGISSVQVALSKLKVDLCETVVVNAHSSEIDLDFSKRSLIILAKKGVKIPYHATVLENLCMEDERIYQAQNFTVESNYTIIFVRR